MAVPHPRTSVVTSGATLVNAALYPYPCLVHAIHVAHAQGSAAWIQVHDSAGVPAEGSVPLITHSVVAGSDADIEGIIARHYFANGVYVCESDTVSTKTLHAATDLFITMIIEDTFPTG